MSLIRHTLAATLTLITLTGCAAQAESLADPLATPQATHDSCIAPGAWYDPAGKQTLDTPKALARLKNASVVLLGETHVIADHHRWHMQTVAQLYAQRPDMILGFEAFPRRVQPVLDQWVAGELSEAAFLKQSEWETVWRYDAKLYLPLFHFARLNKIPMVALNVDRALLNDVSKKGWKNVPKAERRGVGNPAPASDGYIKMLGESYGQHDNGNGAHNGAPKGPGLNDPRFAGFVEVQVTWDRAMAEAAANALQTARAQGRDPQLVGVIGRGHLDYGYGVPHQLKDLGISDVMVAVPWDKLRPCDELTQGSAQGPLVADLAYGLATTEDYLPRETDGPKLGVMIESAEGGILIKKVLKDSIAEASKLKADDLIVRAADQPLAKTGDLVTIIKAMPPGAWLPLTVRRPGANDGQEMEIIARFPAPKP